MGLKARDEAARAVAARDFLTEMFRVADPDRAKGTEPTARHILENASERAVVDLKDQPELLASVLAIVAQMQENMGQFTVADKTLARLATIQERLGQRRNLAMTQTARALNAYRLGDDARAEALIAEADVAAKPFPEDHELQAKLLLTRGWISRGAGRYEKAREEMNVAMTQAALAFGPNHLHTVQAMRGLAEVEGELGDHDTALRLLADAVAARSPPSSDERYRLEVAIVHANALLKAGRFKEATDAGGRLMPECERLSGRHSSDCDFLRRLWAAALLRSEGPESALPLVDDLMVSSANASAPLLQAVSAITAARVLSETGWLRALNCVASSARSAPKRRCRRLTGSRRCSDWPRPNFSRVVPGSGEMGAAGAVPARIRKPGAFSGRAKVTLGLSLAGQGRIAEALALLESADPDLDADLGSEHPSTDPLRPEPRHAAASLERATEAAAWSTCAAEDASRLRCGGAGRDAWRRSERAAQVGSNETGVGPIRRRVHVRQRGMIMELTTEQIETLHVRQDEPSATSARSRGASATSTARSSPSSFPRGCLSTRSACRSANDPSLRLARRYRSSDVCRRRSRFEGIHEEIVVAEEVCLSIRFAPQVVDKLASIVYGDRADRRGQLRELLREALEFVRRLGFSVTTTGAATMCVRGTSSQFSRAFDTAPPMGGWSARGFHVVDQQALDAIARQLPGVIEDIALQRSFRETAVGIWPPPPPGAGHLDLLEQVPKLLGADRAHAMAVDGAGVRVMVFDSDFAFDHRYFLEREANCTELLVVTTRPLGMPLERISPTGHGTAMAALVLAVAPRAEIVGMKLRNKVLLEGIDTALALSQNERPHIFSISLTQDMCDRDRVIRTEVPAGLACRATWSTSRTNSVWPSLAALPSSPEAGTATTASPRR